MNTRTYERVTPEHTESVFVHIDDTGRVRMTADSLHQLLTAIGFQPTKPKD